MADGKASKTHNQQRSRIIWAALKHKPQKSAWLKTFISLASVVINLNFSWAQLDIRALAGWEFPEEFHRVNVFRRKKRVQRSPHHLNIKNSEILYVT